jgi:cephalosporin hydroxylase
MTQSLVWQCALDGPTLSSIQRGTLATRYKGVAFLKNPFDIALYLQLLDRLRPRTVIEVGTNEGGSALWFADMIQALGLPPRVLSIDLDAKVGFTDPRIAFIKGDARRLGDALSLGLLAGLAHPWLVTEDSSHYYDTSRGTLDFFHPHLHRGDYIVIEDGVVKFLPEEGNRVYQDGPNRAVEDFLRAHAEEYEIDRDLCDFYGTNVTWNPNSWLRRL